MDKHIIRIAQVIEKLGILISPKYLLKELSFIAKLNHAIILYHRYSLLILPLG